jgi:anthranilate phosphoribosyltransferase
MAHALVALLLAGLAVWTLTLPGGWIALLFVAALLYLAYQRLNLLAFTATALALLVAYTVLGKPPLWWGGILWAGTALLVLLNVRPLRKAVLTRPFLKVYRRMLPAMSDTEREALEAGTVWWDGELFTGKPDWSKLLSAKAPQLTAEEQAFLDGPCEELCGMVDDFDITHRRGDMPPEMMRQLLPMLPVETISPEELAGAVEAVMECAVTFSPQPDAVDCCGTGGDGQHSLNISTATAIVVAATGTKVAKHGNSAVSSKSGSADVLAALGVKIDAAPAILNRCLRDVGLAFFFAQQFHPGFKHVAGIRRELGQRTIFNLLGPLSNPARVPRQLIGVFDRRLIPTYVEAARLLGRASVLVVHGEDGGDECSISAATLGATLRQTIRFTPEDAGLTRHAMGVLSGGDAKANAQALRTMLSGVAGAYRDAVLLNAAAARLVAGRAATLPEGVAAARESLDSGVREIFSSASVRPKKILLGKFRVVGSARV